VKRGVGGRRIRSDHEKKRGDKKVKDDRMGRVSEGSGRGELI